MENQKHFSQTRKALEGAKKRKGGYLALED
jgi:hypothetical protein